MPTAAAANSSHIPADRVRNNGFGTFSQFAIPGCNDCEPTGMTLGRDNRIWFADLHGGTVGSIDASGNFAIHNVDASQRLLNYDVAANQTHIWFTAFDPNGINGWVGHLADGKTNLYALPFTPRFIAPGVEDVWVGDSNQIAKVAEDGTTSVFTLDTSSNVEDLVRGPDGNIWFTDEFNGSTSQSRIGKITPLHGKVTEYVVPDTQPAIIGIAVGPDGNLWFTDGRLIGKCTPGGAITTYPIPTQTNVTFAIASGPANDLYFTEDDSIGRITLNPIAISEFKVPFPQANPFDIALGADSNIWFSVQQPGLIGRFATH